MLSKNRKDIIAEIFENIVTMQRFIYARHTSSGLPKELPTRAQMCMMMLVSQCDMVSIKDLAQRLGMTSSAITQVVDDLVEKKMLLRREDKQDRRKIGVSLTEKGKKNLEQAKKHRMASFNTLYEALDDTELKLMMDLQKKILDHLKS